MATWTLDKGKILADGKVQDMATYLWTLLPDGQDVSIERRLILQEKRLPAIARLGFGARRDTEMRACRVALGQPEVIALVKDQQPCPIAVEYRQELGIELRKMAASKLATFLGI